MIWHWKENLSAVLNNIPANICTELKDNGGWTQTDAGYNVVTDPNDKFDVYFYLEDTNKRGLVIEIGEHGVWSTGSHTMGTPRIRTAIVFRAGAVVGTETGALRMGYDEKKLIVALDWSGNGADWFKAVSWVGLAETLASGDECLTAHGSYLRGTYDPGCDEDGKGLSRILRDVGGTASKPRYETLLLSGMASGLHADTHCPENLRILANKQDKRYLLPLYLFSETDLGGTSEAAGIRCWLGDIYAGCQDDTESHGQVLKAIDNKEYMFFVSQSYYTYNSLPAKLLIRKV